MPDDVSNNIPFSLGLEVLPATAFQLINSSGHNNNSSYPSSVYSSSSNAHGSSSAVYVSPSTIHGSSGVVSSFTTDVGSSGAVGSLTTDDGLIPPDEVGDSSDEVDDSSDEVDDSSGAVGSFNTDDGLIPSVYNVTYRQKLPPMIKNYDIPMENDVYVANTDLKQVYIDMGIFQSFPVQMENNEYTYIRDEISTNSSGVLAGGRLGFCDKLDASIMLDLIQRGGNFKVGARIGHSKGMEYLKKFYPNTNWNNNDFANLEKAGFFLAEMLIPAGGADLQPVRCALVDDGNNGEWKIDVMGAFCSLNIFKNLFKVTATKTADNSTHIIGDTIKFPFADEAYNYKKGEILGYSPGAIYDWLSGRENCTVSKNSPFKGNYSVERIHAGQNKKVLVKFYIDQSNKKAAEALVNKELPQELFEPNYLRFQRFGEGNNASPIATSEIVIYPV